MQTVENYHNLIRKDVFPLVPPAAGRVLDLGGGVGATSAALKERGCADYLVLCDQVADDALASVDEAFALDLNDQAALASTLASAGPFDTVLCLDVLEHLIDPWETLRVVEMNLAEDGEVVISLPNVSHWSVTLPLIFAGQFEYKKSGIKDRTHLRWFARNGAVDLLTNSGLTVEQVRSKIWRRTERWANRLTLKIFERHFVTQYLLVGRKARTSH